jgi:glycosidase
MKIRRLLSILLLVCSVAAFAGNVKNTISRIDPAFWWVGMQQSELELLVYHPGIGAGTVSANYPGVELKKVEKAENPDYLYLTLSIGKDAKAGIVPIEVQLGKKKLTYAYELRQRNAAQKKGLGVNTSDLIYLIMPDRFANGDPKNDVVAGMNETALNRDSMYYRHGGDLQGIINQLDYLQDLGLTALWLNPVQENNEIKTSYHGYAITDHYKIDPRFGDNALYVKLVDALHARGMKMVMDIVPNHIGIHHWLFLNMPSKDWVNQWDSFTKTSYRAPTLVDQYASEYDRKKFNDGWFDQHMPDLNQRNPHVAKYLTQSYIWWIEYAGVDDFRIDTYAYSDQAYMAQLSKDLHREYPKLNLFGEIWDHGVGVQAFFTEGFRDRGNFNSGLNGAVDFQINFALSEALTKPFGWTEGLSRLYYVIAQDNLYTNPNRNVTFLDNHDLSRFASVIGGDLRKYKMGVAFLMTMRGIPSAYYGTELLMKGFSNPDGLVRADFSGGWATDAKNKFTAAGRNAEENETFNYFRTLAQWRKNTPEAQNGKLMQFVPEESIYTFFRYSDSKSIMVIMNCNDKQMDYKINRFAERIGKHSTAKDVATGKDVTLTDMKLEAWEVKVLEF